MRGGEIHVHGPKNKSVVMQWDMPRIFCTSWQYICLDCIHQVSHCRFCNREYIWENPLYERQLSIERDLSKLAETEEFLKRNHVTSIWEYEREVTFNSDGKAIGRKMLGDKEERERQMKEYNGVNDPEALRQKLELEERQRWEKLSEREKEYEMKAQQGMEGSLRFKMSGMNI